MEEDGPSERKYWSVSLTSGTSSLPCQMTWGAAQAGKERWSASARRARGWPATGAAGTHTVTVQEDGVELGEGVGELLGG